MAWNICETIKGICFDTTSVNSGHRNGACILLENKIEGICCGGFVVITILEIFSEAVVVQALGPSTCPDISLQSRWYYIDMSRYTR